ncbi:uncharacterized protein LOC134208070 [Armigeres subalbatus]|uniref:uncharacterized protein LOC134208070 n=1 Tax=Armigeres subalbatus TaxID=124917 RepID=UPI002ED3EECB
MVIQIASNDSSQNDSEDDVKIERSLRSEGIVFPLRQEEDIERLERMVREDPFLRQQYIDHISKKVCGQQNIVSDIQKIFTNKSLENYTYDGVYNSKYPRKAMKHYDIFTDCLLTAWMDDVTADELKKALIKTTQKAKQNLSSARYYQRYRNRLLEQRKVSWRLKAKARKNQSE